MRDRTTTGRSVLAGLIALMLAPVVAQSRAAAQVSTPPGSASASAAQSPIPPAPSSAAAPSSSGTSTTETVPEQVVWLTNGSIIRGTIVELIPQQRVVLQLATGEIRTIPWAEIARSSFVAAPPPSSGRPSLATSASAAPVRPGRAAAPPAGVTVEIIGDRPGLRIESRRRFTDDPWTVACRAPCAQPIEVSNKSLRIAGDGVRPSNPFFIDGPGGHEVLAVRSGSSQVHAWGQRSLIGGLALGMAGGAAYGLGKVQDSDPAVVGGLVSMIVGGALVALSLPLLGASGTHVLNSKGDRIGRTDGTWVW